MWPAQTGLSQFLTILNDFSGKYAILSNFLKFEDTGYFNAINVTSSMPAPTTNSDDNSSDNNTTTNMNSTSSTSSSLPPEEYIENPSSALANYTCDVAGSSWYYRENVSQPNLRTITVHSCPNHFSSCQSAECAGTNNSRALVYKKVLIIPSQPFISTLPPSVRYYVLRAYTILHATIHTWHRYKV